MAGDVSSYVGSSSDELRRTTDVGAGDSAQEDAKREDKCNDPDRDDSNSESEEDVAAPFEVCLDVDMVMCKAGTTLFQAPFSPDK